MAGFFERRRLAKFKQKGIHEHLRLLAQGSDKQRADVANALWGYSTELSPDEAEAAIGGLMTATGDPDPTVRGNAIAAVLELKAPGAVDVAMAALSDPDWFVRTIVTAQLGHQDHDAAIVAAVTPLLSDPNEFVRAQAAGALGNQGDPKSIPALELMLQQEKDVDAKDAAKEALARLRGR